MDKRVTVEKRPSLKPGELDRQAEALAAALATERFTEVNRIFFALRALGVGIPLEFTLLLRNFYMLDRWAKRAGLTGFRDALAYAP